MRILRPLACGWLAALAAAGAGADEGEVDLGLRLQVRVGLDGRGRAFQGVELVGTCAWMATDRLQVRVDAGVSLYDGGIGTDRRLRGADPRRGWQRDAFAFLTLATGDGTGEALPVALHTPNLTSAVDDRWRQSVSLGFGWQWNSALDILGTQALARGRMNDVSLAGHNDCGIFSDAPSDCGWTGGGVLHVRAGEHLLLALGHEVYTGDNDGLLPGNPAGAWGNSSGTAAQRDHYLYNRAVTWIEASDPVAGGFVRLGFSGPSVVQNAIHALIPSDRPKNAVYLMPDAHELPEGDFTLPVWRRFTVEAGWRFPDGGGE